VHEHEARPGTLQANRESDRGHGRIVADLRAYRRAVWKNPPRANLFTVGAPGHTDLFSPAAEDLRPDSVSAVTHAIVLIKAGHDSLDGLGEVLADVDGVAEAYSVTGEWDFVAMVRVSETERLADVVAAGLAKLPGIERTHTMVAFEVYSRHDLESMFSIGE